MSTHEGAAVRTANTRRRPRWLLAAASGLALTLAGGLLAVPPAADAAIAGVTSLVDVPQGRLETPNPECGENTYCAFHPVTLSADRIFQVQVNNPTADVSLTLRDSLGNVVVLRDNSGSKVESLGVKSGDTRSFNVVASTDGTAKHGVEAVTVPGEHTIVVSSRSAVFYALHAFEIPTNLKKVALGSTTRSTFSDRSTHRLTGKSVRYRDGVVFDARKGAKVSALFTKPGERGASIAVYDAFGNRVTFAEGTDSAKVSDFVIPYTGLYQIYVEGGTQGKFSLKLSQYVKVQKVSVSKKSVTLRLNKKSKKKVQLKAVVAPSNASSKKVRWVSSNTRVAKVSKSGKVTAVRAGKATITVTSLDGGKGAKVKVVVKKR